MSQHESSDRQNHLAWVDLLRVIAIFQVILIHASFPIFLKGELPRSYWMAANFYDAFSRISVPIFFMISGYLLIGREESIRDFLSRRIIKVGIPALVWTVAYLLWKEEAYRDGSMNILRIALSMGKAVFGGHTEIHLWFIYILLGLYLATPLLRVLASASPSILKYFLALWLLANPVLNLLGRISGEIPDAGVRLLFAEGYIGYFVLGYVLGQSSPTPQNGRLALLLSMVTGAGIYFATDIFSRQAGAFDEYFYSSFNFPVIVMACCFFYWGKSLENAFVAKNMKWLTLIADTAFGIYLIHVFVMEALRAGALGFTLYSWMGPAAYMIPLTGIATFAMSFAVIVVIKRIPILKYAV